MSWLPLKLLRHLAAVENEAGRTTDPVRMYMREMGTVELLTREGEIVIAKRIEEGIRELMSAMAFFPGTIERVLDEYDLVEKEEKRLADILIGYLDLSEDVIPRLSSKTPPPPKKLMIPILMMTTAVTMMTMKRQPVLIRKKRAFVLKNYANSIALPCVS